MSDGVLQGLRGEALAEKEATLKAFALGDSGEVEGLLERLFEVSDLHFWSEATLVRRIPENQQHPSFFLGYLSLQIIQSRRAVRQAFKKLKN